MAYLGDIVRSVRQGAITRSFNVFGFNNRTRNVTVLLDNATPRVIATMENFDGFIVARARATDSGQIFIYDLDDGNYRAYASGDVWRIAIVAGVATVSKEFSSRRTLTSAHIG